MELELADCSSSRTQDKLMRACLYESHGGPEVLQLKQIARPTIQLATDVVIQVYAVGLNPVGNNITFPAAFTTLCALGRLQAAPGSITKHIESREMVQELVSSAFSQDFFHRPVIVGCDVAGIVFQRGDEARKFEIGEAVFACLPPNRIGGLAE